MMDKDKQAILAAEYILNELPAGMVYVKDETGALWSKQSRDGKEQVTVGFTAVSVIHSALEHGWKCPELVFLEPVRGTVPYCFWGLLKEDGSRFGWIGIGTSNDKKTMGWAVYEADFQSPMEIDLFFKIEDVIHRLKIRGFHVEEQDAV